MPDHATYTTDVAPDAVLEQARAVLGKRGYRLRAVEGAADDAVSSERGYLREVGNLVFHLAVLVVLVGFALGGLFGYKGGVILTTGTTFANNPTQYDDFVPGSLFQADRMNDFRFRVEDFDVDWTTSGPRTGMARNFDADVRYREGDGEEQQYDLRVNHPLKIGSTELFLIGHGYSPVVTVRDGSGDVVWRGPQPFLPQGPDLLSFGVVKAQDANPGDEGRQIGLEGFLYPSFVLTADGNPANLYGAATNPLLSLNVYSGDLNMDGGESQSVYVLDKSKAEPLPGKAGQAAPDRPERRRDRDAARRARDGHLRRPVLVAADPDQPDAGQADRARRRRARAARADGLAVHPVAPGLGAGDLDDRRDAGRGGRPRAVRRRGHTIGASTTSSRTCVQDEGEKS